MGAGTHTKTLNCTPEQLDLFKSLGKGPTADNVEMAVRRYEILFQMFKIGKIVPKGGVSVEELKGLIDEWKTLNSK